MTQYRFTSAALTELRQATLHYEQRENGLGMAFLNEVEATLNRILQHPTAWHPLSSRTRRCRTNRPCRICGKPTYCGFSRDEGTSICMRISAGSRGLSRNGGNIQVHPKIPFITIRSTFKRPTSQLLPPAPLDIRDAVFQELIRISPASNYMEELVTGPAGLLSRGLLEDHATSYGALPRIKQQRTALAGILNDYVCAHFPEYAKFHSGAGVIGVPGFWQELSGTVHVWKPRNYLMPLLVVPYKDANGLIQACENRSPKNLPAQSFRSVRRCGMSERDAEMMTARTYSSA